MILQERDPPHTLEEVQLSDVVFWVQIHGLPLEIMDEDNARLTGRMLGTILELDDIDDHQSFIRLKIRFPTSKPLEPGFSYSREDGVSIWIGFKYKRLSSFCFHFGLLDHTIGTCYQNSPHPQSFALTDKMRGSTYLGLHCDQQLGGSLAGSVLEGPWKSLQSVTNLAAVPDGQTVVATSPSFTHAGTARVSAANFSLGRYFSHGKNVGIGQQADSLRDRRDVRSMEGDSVILGKGQSNGNVHAKNFNAVSASTPNLPMNTSPPLEAARESLKILQLDRGYLDGPLNKAEHVMGGVTVPGSSLTLMSSQVTPQGCDSERPILPDLSVRLHCEKRSEESSLITGSRTKRCSTVAEVLVDLDSKHGKEYQMLDVNGGLKIRWLICFKWGWQTRSFDVDSGVLGRVADLGRRSRPLGGRWFLLILYLLQPLRRQAIPCPPPFHEALIVDLSGVGVTFDSKSPSGHCEIDGLDGNFSYGNYGGL